MPSSFTRPVLPACRYLWENELRRSLRMRRRALPFLWFALIGGAYVGAAKLGIQLPVAKGVITPIWAPSGIALAALLILGLRYWPAVAIGAFVANATSEASAGVAAGITV